MKKKNDSFADFDKSLLARQADTERQIANKSFLDKKKPITVVLTEKTHAALLEMALTESRPVAQMARVIIEKAVNK